MIGPETLAGVGMTLIVTKSKLFEPLRNAVLARSIWWATLIGCPMCFGFWAGIFWGLVTHALLPLPSGLHAWLAASADVFGAGCSVSLLSWFMFLAHHKLGGDEILHPPPLLEHPKS